MYKSDLAQIAQTILDVGAYQGVLRDAVIDLMDLCANCSDMLVPSDVGEKHQGTLTGAGLALSPHYAVRSMIDYYRTVQFIRGLYSAIRVALKKFEVPIHVLYAGTGPYAPLALPLTTIFQAEQVKFTMLDIHQESLMAVKKSVSSLQKQDYVKAYVQADAISYRHPEGDPIHIVITETMQTGLEKETQVAITHNLMPQLCDGGFFIPEKIEVHLSLVQPTRPNPGDQIVLREYADLGVVYELGPGKGISSQWSEWRNNSLCIEGATIDMPSDHWPEYNGIVFTTRIAVFQNIELKDRQSSLTIARPLPGMGSIRPKDRVRFYYEICEKPGMRYEVLNAS